MKKENCFLFCSFGFFFPFFYEIKVSFIFFEIKERKTKKQKQKRQQNILRPLRGLKRDMQKNLFFFSSL